ncbi:MULTISPECIES: hypothetical protein [Kineococcus]|nr:hypothetical protein [Kineococcus sp. TRM81007]
MLDAFDGEQVQTIQTQQLVGDGALAGGVFEAGRLARGMHGVAVR